MTAILLARPDFLPGEPHTADLRRWLWLWANGREAALAADLRANLPTDISAPTWAVARRHGVLPILLDAATHAGVNLAGGLRHLRLMGRGFEMLLASEAAKVLMALSAAGIRAVPLKGLSLAGRAYSPGAMRAMADLDILVPYPVRPALTALARAHGFRPATADPQQFAFDASREGKHVILAPPAKPGWVEVELHHHLFPDLADTVAADVLARAEPAICGFSGANIFQADANDTFILIAHHLMMNEFREAKWWLDIDRVARFWPLDADFIAARCEAWGDPLSVIFAMGGAAELLGTPIADKVWRKLCRLLRPAERRLIGRAADDGFARSLNKLDVLRALAHARGIGRRHHSVVRVLFPHPGEVATIIGRDSRERGFWRHRLLFALRRIFGLGARLTVNLRRRVLHPHRDRVANRGGAGQADS